MKSTIYHAQRQLFVLLMLLSFQSMGQGLVWGPKVLVADGATYGSIRPRIVLTANETPLVMWGGGVADQPLYSSRWNGGSFDTPVQMTPNMVDPAVQNWMGPGLAANGDVVYSVFKAEPEMSSSIYLIKSLDGGATWSDTLRVDTPDGPYTRFPSVAVDGNSNPSVLYMVMNSSWLDPQYHVRVSIDQGLTFGPSVNASANAPGEVCDCCPATNIADGNTQIAMFRNNDNDVRTMWAGNSSDGGASYPATEVDLSGTIIPSCISSGPTGIIKGDSLYMTWMNIGSGSNRVWLGSMSVSTGQVGFNVMLNDTYAALDRQNYPRISGPGDTLGVVWELQVNGNTDSYLSWSVNGPLGLIENEEIIHSNTANNQVNPDVAYSNGTFHLVYQDRATNEVFYRTATISASAGLYDVKLDEVDCVPNPMQQSAIISFPNLNSEQVDLSIYDESGRVVKRMNGHSSSFLVERGALPEGTYIYKLTFDSKKSLQGKLLME